MQAQYKNVAQSAHEPSIRWYSTNCEMWQDATDPIPKGSNAIAMLANARGVLPFMMAPQSIHCLDYLYKHIRSEQNSTFKPFK